MSLTVTRPQQAVPFCTNLDLKAAHELAVAELERAQRNAPPGMEVSSPVALAAREVRRLEDEMREHTVVFTLTGWPRKQWAEFEESHKAREGQEVDKTLGIDVSALDEAIAGAIVSVKTLAGDDVPFTPGADWTPLADEMTNAQWEDFALAVLRLNRGVKDAPFSRAASAAIRGSELTSKRPNA